MVLLDNPIPETAVCMTNLDKDSQLLNAPKQRHQLGVPQGKFLDLEFEAGCFRFFQVRTHSPPRWL